MFGLWGGITRGRGGDHERSCGVLFDTQVLPDVLHVCQLCVHTAVTAEGSQLASTVPLLPLGHLTARILAVPHHHVHHKLVLRSCCPRHCHHCVQVHRVQRVSGIRCLV